VSVRSDDAYNQLTLAAPTPGHIVSPATVFIVAAGFYYWTAYPSITWWDNAEYSLAAATFGIPHPPGSLLLVLLGWPVSKLSSGTSPAYALNLFAGVLAALTAAGTCLLAMAIDRFDVGARRAQPPAGVSIMTVLALLAGGLIFALSQTLWQYAIMFTPYVLTALFTVLILTAMLRWWRVADGPSALNWLLLITLLFGLDFSVHRTNLLLLPGLIIWVLLRRARSLKFVKTWLIGLAGLLIGLSAQLLLIPMAMRDPALNAINPTTFSRWWDYVAVKQYGGAFLIKLWPRNGAFFGDQVTNYLRVFADNFMPVGSGPGFLGLVPLLLGLGGIVLLWYRHRRLCIGLVVLLLCSSLGAVIYFNVPADFFRSMARHYMPSLVIFAAFMIYAAVVIVRSLFSRPGVFAKVGGVMLLVIVVAAAVYQPVHNYRRVDGCGNFFAVDFAANALNSLPENAIVVTAGDNDTYPLWYMTLAEQVRPDVIPINLHLLNTTWYIDQLLARHPDFPLPLTRHDRSRLNIIPWRDTTICIPVTGNAEAFDLPDSVVLPDSMCLAVPPTVDGKYLMIHDRILLEITTSALSTRPLYFMTTVSTQAIPYLSPYLQMQGLVSRVVPVASPPLNLSRLETNLTETYKYRGGNNETVRIGRWDHRMVTNYYPLWFNLIEAERADGDSTAARDHLDLLERLLPPERLDPPDPYRQYLNQLSSLGP